MTPEAAAGPGEYRLEVGDTIIALVCPQAGLAEGLAEWFGRASADPAADPAVTLELKVVGHDDQPTFPRSLLTTKRLLPDGGFDIADGLIRGRWDAATGRGALTVKAALMRGRFARIFEQVLYQAFMSARRRRGGADLLVHSSAVVAGGQGFLFVGPSGAGKSTVARLSADRHVLGDEINLLRPAPGGWEVVGTPFNGLFRDKRPGCAPLRAVLLLEHGPDHRLGEPAPADAVATLAGEIVPPVGLDEVPDPATLPAMIDAARAVAGQTSLKVLSFAPDAGFWRALAEAYDLPPPPRDPSA